MKTLLRYLKQPSTLRGLIGVVAGFGLVLSPEQTEAVLSAAAAAIVAVEVFRDEDKKNEK